MSQPAPRQRSGPAPNPSPSPGPGPSLGRSPNPGPPAPPYQWERRGAHCFACIGAAEVSRPRRGQPWVALIPLAMDGAVAGAWALMRDPAGTGIRHFASARDAMAAAEHYLSIFFQYHQPGRGEALDPAAGAGGVSGGRAGGYRAAPRHCP